jgi:hemolysin activation/secretion protein
VWGRDFRWGPSLVECFAVTLSMTICGLGAASPGFAEPASPKSKSGSTQKSGPAPQKAAPAAKQKAAGQEERPAAGAPAPLPPFDIYRFRVDGSNKLAQIDVEDAIYPFLGPKRTADDVEKARAALEKAYHDRGYQTVNVSIPAQNVASGIVILKVAEAKVGRLRVTNSRYFDVEKIKKKAPSLREGGLPNFNDVTSDIVALNQWPDRRVTPALRAGVTPGTVDVDLNVEDKYPLHGNFEVNNRQSQNTTPTRTNATIKYDNLWQLGHSFSFTYQVAPQQKKDAEVFSGSYLARITDWTSLLVYAVDSKSDVATIGGMNVVGPGQILGMRGVFTLPTRDNFFHSLSVGIDYKHFGQTVHQGVDSFSSPITYYPLSATYGATFQHEGALSQFNLGLTGSLRGLGSDFQEFIDKRSNSNASFFHLNADFSHTRELPEGFQAFSRVKVQIADGPLVSSEQFSVGGLDTVRGFFESEVIGDNGWAATVEIRTPDIAAWLQNHFKDETGMKPAPINTFNEFRFFTFMDAGMATIYEPLAEQESRFELWSFGIGSRFKMFDYLNGMVALALPASAQGFTRTRGHRVLFSAGGEF